MLVWMMLRARSASRSSMTQEMLISLAPVGVKTLGQRSIFDGFLLSCTLEMGGGRGGS